jgi:Spy/CpxP family protein refolding chaperone
MNKTIITIMAVFFAAVVSTSAFASNWGRGPGYDRSKGSGPCYSENFRGVNQLNLTQEQTAKLAEIKNAHTKAMMPLREQMFAKRNAIKALWLEANPNQEKILAAHKDMRAVRDQIQDKNTAFRLESLKVLTPAQQEIVKAQSSARRPGARGGKMNTSRGGAGSFQFGPGFSR